MLLFNRTRRHYLSYEKSRFCATLHAPLPAFYLLSLTPPNHKHAPFINVGHSVFHPLTQLSLFISSVPAMLGVTRPLQIPISSEAPSAPSANYTHDQAVPRAQTGVSVLDSSSQGTSLPPSTSFSTELLMRLFRVTLASLRNDENLPYFIMALSHVCRRWRSIVLTSPDLWTDVHMVPGRVNLAHRFFLRSENMRVDISIATSSTADFSIDEIIQIKELLRLHVLRAHSCIIRIQSDMFGTDASTEDDPPRFTVIPGYRVFLDTMSSMFPDGNFANLVHFELETCDPVLLDGLVPLLGHCPALQVLTLRKIRMTPSRMDEVALSSVLPVKLPKLRQLNVVGCSVFYTDYLLCMVFIPPSTAVHLEFSGRCLKALTQSSSLQSVLSTIQGATLRFIKNTVELDAPGGHVRQEALVHLYSNTRAFSAQWRWGLVAHELTDAGHVGEHIFELPRLKQLSVYLQDVDVTRAMWRQILGRIPPENELSLDVHPSLQGTVRRVMIPNIGVQQRLPVNYPEPWWQRVIDMILVVIGFALLWLRALTLLLYI
ncbi:hypothetical protein BKA93DRAFT_806191 [Sparassis latifolia]